MKIVNTLQAKVQLLLIALIIIKTSSCKTILGSNNSQDNYIKNIPKYFIKNQSKEEDTDLSKLSLSSASSEPKEPSGTSSNSSQIQSQSDT